jgi:hypothetical protein
MNFNSSGCWYSLTRIISKKKDDEQQQAENYNALCNELIETLKLKIDRSKEIKEYAS